MIKRALLLLVSGGLGACSTIDTGYIDYRRAESVDAVAKLDGYDTKTCAPQYETAPLGRRTDNAQDSGGSRAKREPCYPLLGARLFRKNLSSRVGIKPEDVYSIRIDHAFLDYVSEWPFRPDRLLDLKNPLRAQAEVVVLARAFEFGPLPKADVAPETATGAAGGSEAGATTEVVETASENAFVDLDFESLNSARVVYYSPDVENGQSLNFSNIPVLGPVVYHGRPVGIQIVILELDRVSPEMKGLLSSLASLGQTAGALPTGGAAEILTNLGKSLLESNQDDIIFEYRFVLDPTDKPNSYNSAPFEAGRYVLRRLQSRNRSLIWRNLLLDHNTGQLFLRAGLHGTATETAAPYVGETYITINVINHGKGAKEAVYVYRSLQELRNTINTTASPDEERTLGGLSADIAAATGNLRGAVATRDLVQDWERVVGDANRLAFAFPPAAFPAGCVPRPGVNDGRSRAEYELQKSLADFTRNWTEAMEKGAKGDMTFGAKEQLRVADAVGAFFFSVDNPPANRVVADDFVDAQAFGQWVTGSEIAGQITDYVDAMQPKDCSSLRAAGFAT